MYGYQQAMQEYEYHMMCPYDKGGALYEEEELYDEEDDLDNDEEYWQETFAQSTEDTIWN